MKPITSSDIPDQWISDAKEAMKRCRYLLRAGPGNTIQIGGQGHPWMALMLPGSGTTFTEASERNVVLRKLLET